MTENEAIILMLVLFAIYFIAITIALAQYVISSYSFYSIAKRRLIPHPWLSFIPVANCWITGSIADDFDQKNGNTRAWKKVLLTLQIVMYSTYILFFISFIIFTILITAYGNEPEIPAGVILTLFFVMFIPYIVLLICAMAYSACNLVCVYKVFESTVPEKATKYFIISMLVPFGYPICLLKCKDKGYYNLPPQPPIDFSAYPPPPPAPFEYNPNDMQMPN